MAGLRLLMVSTTGEHHAYYELDEDSCRCSARCRRSSQWSTGFRRTASPLCRYRAFHGRRRLAPRRCHGKPGAAHPVRQGCAHLRDLRRCAGLCLARQITFMVDVTRVPENAFGYVPTPALSHRSSSRCGSPTMPPSAAISTGCGRWHRSVGDARRQVPHRLDNPWPFTPQHARRSHG